MRTTITSQHPTATHNITTWNSQHSQRSVMLSNTAVFILWDNAVSLTIDPYFWLSLSIQGKGHCLPAFPELPWKPHANNRAACSHELFLPRQLLSHKLSRKDRDKNSKAGDVSSSCPCIDRLDIPTLSITKVDKISHLKHQLREESGGGRKIESKVFSDFPIRNDAALLMVFSLRKVASPFHLKTQVSLSHFAVSGRML